MEIDNLKALNVFVDTSVFIGKNYQYEHPSFIALKEAVSAGRANLLITDITIEEVTAHIDNDVSESSQALKKVRSAAKILRNIATPNNSAIFIDIDRKSVSEELNKQFRQFLTDARAAIVPVSEANTRFVFDCYFKRAAPFGEGKKKSEFPDAFALSALNEWAKSMQEDVFVVSQDSDMKGVEVDFPRLSTLRSLEDFLGKVTSYFEELAPLAKKLLEENLSHIANTLEEKFQGLGFVLTDQDGDVNDTKVTKVGEISAYLISLTTDSNGEPAEARFELTTTIEYKADVSYDNLETASYDSEDKVLIPWETVERTVERSETIQADLRFTFNTTEPHSLEIKEFDLHTPKDVSVSTDEDDGWPYK
jgi:predicted nucleic acid-binding protein